MAKKLYLSRTNRKIGGVCGGIGEYLDVDPTVIRVVWVLLLAFSLVVPAVLAYVLLWVVLPPPPPGEGL